MAARISRVLGISNMKLRLNELDLAVSALLIIAQAGTSGMNSE